MTIFSDPSRFNAWRGKFHSPRGLTLALFAMICVVTLAAPVISQRTSGQITGVVLDPSGAAIPDISVTMTQVGTGFSRTVTTSQSGLYTATDLPVGIYRISASGTGFKEAVVANVTVNVASITRQDINMQVGDVGETVNIVAGAVQVQTESGEVSGVITGEQVRELPLNGRSFVQLTQLQPGVSAASNFDSKNKGLFSGVDFAVNGNSTQGNLFLTDGANNNDTGSNRTILLYPSIEAIAEFKMLRNSYGPEYGQAAGSVISIVTRGGSNEFHGSLFYFGRNDKLNSTDFFATDKDKLRRNDFGWSIGGPIVKDRLFFFYSQEFNKEIRGFTRFGSVPTMAERQGDFSNPRFAGNQRCSGPDPLGPAVIPNNDLSPVGLLIAQLYPEPNVANPSDCTNWRESTNANVDFREENFRIDYKISDKHQLFGRYTQDTWKNPAPILLTAGLWGDDAFTSVESGWSQPSKQAAFKLTSQLSESAVNEVQFSYSGNRINITTDIGNGLNEQITNAMPTFFPGSGKSNPTVRPHPVFWGGIQPFSSNFGPDLWSAGPWDNSLDIYSVRDDFALVKGDHVLKMGFLYDKAAKDEDSQGSAGSEVPHFWGSCGGWCPAGRTDVGDNALYNLLTRNTYWGYDELSTQPVALTRYRNVELYFGDTWKARQNLTLQLGARYSYFPEPVDANDAMTTFDPGLYDPTKPAGDFCNGIVSVPGTDPCAGIPNVSNATPSQWRGLRENVKNAIAPRLGFAWDIFSDGKTVIRGGLGQFYQRERVSLALGLVANAPFALVVTGTRALDDNGPNTILVDGAPGGSPSRSIDPRAALPYSWQWNFIVDREIFKDTVIEFGYVGNRALNQLITYDVNAVSAQNRLDAALIGAGGNVNPFRPASNFGFITGVTRRGTADYHSLQALFKTRFGRSQFQAAYTWSKSIANVALDDSSGGASANSALDISQLNLERGPSGINRPHIFVANVIYNFPSLNGRNPVVKAFAGGWEVASIISLTSGSSLNPRITSGVLSNLTSISGVGTSQSNERPDVVPGSPCKLSGGDSLNFVNTGRYTLIGHEIGKIGSASRGDCLGPGLKNVDLSVYKNFTPGWLTKGLGEGARVQFRLEFFNLFNTANYRSDFIQNNMNFLNGGFGVVCGPSQTTCTNANRVISGYVDSGNNIVPESQVINGNFGRAGSTRGPREVQYSLKLIF